MGGKDSEDIQPGAMAPMTSDYNELNLSQSTVWPFAKPLFSNALTLYSGSDSFRVADLGCATGGNSLAPLTFVASQLAANSVLEVFLCDLPSNAWDTVASTVTPHTISHSGTSGANTTTFIYMVGRSFYQCCAPPASLDLSYCFVAVHWMESHAGDMPSGMYATDPLHFADTPEEQSLLQAWKAAGARDWSTFLQARHKELRMGGRFIGIVACPKECGDCPWSQVGYILYQVLLRKKRASTPAAAIEACVLPCCYRTEDDVRAGFSGQNGECWELEVCEFHETIDPVREHLGLGSITPVEYGTSVVQSFRSVCHPTFVNSMTKHMPQKDVEEVLEEAYSACVEQIAASPEVFNLDVSFWYVMAKKTQNPPWRRCDDSS